MVSLAEERLPSMFQWPETAESGGFAAYGPRFINLSRQRARMIAKILGGARPADTPVEQPDHFELVINLSAARALRHEVPAGLLARADKVIE
jgi:putative ABC transport system substrate-binding protein